MNSPVNNNDEEFGFDFSEIMESSYPQEEAMEGMIDGLITASNHQADTAYNLTQLIVDHQGDTSLSADEILDIYRQAAITVAESSPLNALWDRLHAQD